jgi:hypothetical protein
MPWYELTRWLAYRSIKHPAMRPYVSTLPLGFSFAATALYLLLPVKPSLTASGGLLSNILTLLAVLPGFFIAALAAVATFNRPEMDEEMPAPCPTIAIYRGGKWLDVNLTRRTFLTYLFSYLSVLSLLAAALCIGGQMIGPSVKGILDTISPGAWRAAATSGLPALFIFVLFSVCASVLVSMLHGIYFIAERIHQPH